MQRHCAVIYTSFSFRASMSLLVHQGNAKAATHSHSFPISKAWCVDARLSKW